MSADDQRLIADCLNGETAAFGELVARYQDRLFGALLRMVGNPEDARDAAQDAFLHAYQALPTFKGDALFFTWLYRIAMNTAISTKRKRRVVLRLQPGADGAGPPEPLDPSDLSRPGHALELAEEEKRVQDALGRLSAEHRAVLVMKDMDGLRYEAIADVLQVPVGTVRSRLHRARLELREILMREEKRAAP